MNPKWRILIPLLPGALLGAYFSGILSGRIQDAMLAKPDTNAWLGVLLPDPFGFLVGLIIFLALSWVQRQAINGAAFKRSFETLDSRLGKKGFSDGSSVKTKVGLFEYEEETIAMADRFVAQVWADRKEVEKYKNALSKYADSSLANSLKHETDFSQVQTKQIQMAVLFTDIRGFTKMSELLTTQEVVSILNDYFALAAEVVHRNGGRINKFIGDAVMAVFEDPAGYKTGSTATKNAVNSGIELVAQFRMKSRQWKEQIHKPFEVDLAAGVNYGSLIFGNMGSPERMEYTAIGDTVNFSSRLCSEASGGQTRISEEAFKLVDGYFDLSPEQPISVKGKAGTFKTWLVGGKKPGA